MNIHEYQAKELFRSFGIPVSDGILANTVDEAVAAANALEGPVWVVKAQVHAGGRGKAGGVKVCKSIDEVQKAASAILGMTLVTKQTGAAGKKVHKVLVERGTNIARELYLAVVLDRSAGCLSIMASPCGGMDIEAVAAETPDKIFITKLDGSHNFWPWQARELFFGCGLDAKQTSQGVAIVRQLVALAVAKDCTMVEINPLAVTDEGKLVAVDAKINFDENGLARHEDIRALDDPDECDPYELKAREVGVNYIHLDGYVGTMVNGAGLAMATMDIIEAFGGQPANFLDVGGGASAEKVAAAFRLLLADKNVRCIFVNIFGGIMRCDVLAEGIVQAAKEVSLPVPLVVRLRGTNWERGAEILAQSGLAITYEPDLAKSAHLAVSLAKGGVQA